MIYLILNIAKNIDAEKAINEINTVINNKCFDPKAKVGGSGETTDYISKGFIDNYHALAACITVINNIPSKYEGYVQAPFKDLESISTHCVMKDSYIKNGKYNHIEKLRDQKKAKELPQILTCAYINKINVFEAIAKINDFDYDEFMDLVCSESGGTKYVLEALSIPLQIRTVVENDLII